MAAILQRVAHQHRGDGEQSEQAERIHRVSFDQSVARNAARSTPRKLS
jgi:hypothetical protein